MHNCIMLAAPDDKKLREDSRFSSAILRSIAKTIMGMIDPISTATGSHALWRRLGSHNKQLVILPGMAHDWSAEFDRQAWRWLEKTLKIKGAQ